MKIIDYTDALDASWRVFPLHEIQWSSSGYACGCGDSECQAIGKHPRQSSWQHTPSFDAEQLAYLEDTDGAFFGNQLLDGYGVVLLTSGLIVVDVDGRNGGFESAEELSTIRESCGFIVQTGSQNGEHWYFKRPKDVNQKSLMTNVPSFPGIDFKSSGFVVGSYSYHKSGNRYDAIKGSPEEVNEAPAALIALMSRRLDFACSSGFASEICEVAAMVQAIPNDAKTSYEEWVEVGMAVHNLTGGSSEGYDVWASWSRISNPGESDALLSSKWRGFGKSPTPVGFSRLFEKATACGYVQAVTFKDETIWEDESPKPEPIKEDAVNLLRPPGIVGEIASWINSRCALPREKLAVAGALQIVSNTAGRNFLVSGRDTSLNLLTLAIAGSRTGKGAIKRCIDEVSYSVGISPATHGKFKSSQELVRNALQHQLVAYVYDEFGKQLEKLSGSSGSGAHYLEDLLAELMAMYSEATGVHGISGDSKREMMEIQDREISREIKKLGLSDGENPRRFAEGDQSCPLAVAYRMRDAAERGIVEPYLTFFGMSEPGAFSAAIEKDPWLLTGGFLGRALIFEEEETVPFEKDASLYNNDKINNFLLNRILSLTVGGYSSSSMRIERGGDWRRIEFAPCGEAFFSSVRKYWQECAIIERDSGSGLESQALGATELAIKVAGLLSVETMRITKTEARWAHELVRSVTHAKMDRARTNDALKSRAPAEKGSGLLGAILRHIDQLDDGAYTTAGRARQSAGRSKVTLEDVTSAFLHLAELGKVSIIENISKGGKKSTRYFKKD